jgi:FAD:protein FMN transferase
MAVCAPAAALAAIFTRAVAAGSRRLVLAAAAAVLLATACSTNDPVYSTTFISGGERIHIVVTSSSAVQAKRLFEQLKEDSLYIEKYWNPMRSGTLRRTNTLLASGKEFSAPPSIIPMIRLSQEYARLSGGKYDAARARYLQQWGYYSGAAASPGSEAGVQATALEPLLPPPSSADVKIADFRLHSDNPNVMFDFGLLAKGYALEMFAKSLRDNGVINAMINIGGDYKVIGMRSGIPWNVAIPRSDNGGVLATIAVQMGEAVMTLGSYSTQAGTGSSSDYPVFDPATLAPVAHTAAVTVVHKDAALASAAAQAIFVAGAAQWRETARAMGVSEVLLVDSDGKLHLSESLHRRLDFLHVRPEMQVSSLQQ